MLGRGASLKRNNSSGIKLKSDQMHASDIYVCVRWRGEGDGGGGGGVADKQV